MARPCGCREGRHTGPAPEPRQRSGREKTGGRRRRGRGTDRNPASQTCSPRFSLARGHLRRSSRTSGLIPGTKAPAFPAKPLSTAVFGFPVPRRPPARRQMPSSRARGGLTPPPPPPGRPPRPQLSRASFLPSPSRSRASFLRASGARTHGLPRRDERPLARPPPSRRFCSNALRHRHSPGLPPRPPAPPPFPQGPYGPGGAPQPCAASARVGGRLRDDTAAARPRGRRPSPRGEEGREGAEEEQARGTAAGSGGQDVRCRRRRGPGGRRWAASAPGPGAGRRAGRAAEGSAPGPATAEPQNRERSEPSPTGRERPRRRRPRKPGPT